MAVVSRVAIADTKEMREIRPNRLTAGAIIVTCHTAAALTLFRAANMLPHR
jgi:hypothetical protein